MKRILLVLLTAVCILPLTAFAARKGALKIRLSDNSPIAVSVDGRLFKKYASTLTVGDLPSGSHYLKLYTYNPKEEKRPLRSIYEKDIRIHKDEITTIVLDVYSGKASITQAEWDADAHTASAPTSTTPAPPRTLDDTYDDFVASPASAISDKKYDKLQHLVSSLQTDTDKLKTAKSGLKKKSLTTEQVGTIMKAFTFEDSKLRFAKWAYNHTSDKGNYRNLKAQFTESAANELDAFISK